MKKAYTLRWSKLVSSETPAPLPEDVSKDVVYLFFGHGDSDLCCQPENGNEDDRAYVKADGNGIAVFRVTAGEEGLQIVGEYSSAKWRVIQEPLEPVSSMPLWGIGDEPRGSGYTNVLRVTVPEGVVVKPVRPSRGGGHEGH